MNANSSQVEWRELPSGHGFYEVSSAGQVRSRDRRVIAKSRWGGEIEKTQRGRVLKPWRDSGGYLAVYICGNGEKVAVNVHRLVAEAFCTKVPGKEHVNHKDGDKKNNAASNLEWCTRSENMHHARKAGLCTSDRGPVIATPKQGGAAIEFTSSKEAAMSLGGLSRAGNIRSALVGYIPSAYGYHWRYAS